MRPSFITRVRQLGLQLLVGVTTVSLFSGCTETLQVLNEMTPENIGSITRSMKAVGKTMKDITPEQEYYIGRAVGASIVSRYHVYDAAEARDYINLLGQTLAQASDKPETFGGYHFLILDDSDINAFAAPGGFIFISRGMLRLAQSEGELAAILAHEAGHVEGQHGLRSIKKSRLTSALTIIAAESAKTFGGDDLAQLTEAFEGSIDDVTQTLVNSGYGRKLEAKADRAAVRILKRVGYDPTALATVLERMAEQLHEQDGGFAKTHPSPLQRVAAVHKAAGDYEASVPNIDRTKRFKTAMKGI